MWGETTPATDRECSWVSYSLAKGTTSDDPKLTKYVPESKSKYGDNGFFDNKTVLDPEDDAAHVALGGKFRMPTYAEWQKLHENCTCTRTRLNGVNGYLVTSTKDGFTDRSLFLPAAGCRSGSGFSRQGSLGYYCSRRSSRAIPATPAATSSTRAATVGTTTAAGTAGSPSVQSQNKSD